jgi:hypothetical protein
VLSRDDKFLQHGNPDRRTTGGEFFADLLIEKDGATYEKESHGSRSCRFFASRTAKCRR